MINPKPVLEWRRSRRQPGHVEIGACRLLRRLASEVPAHHAVVELGAYAGRSTGWLLLGAQEGRGAHVTTVDPWEAYAGDYYLPEHGYAAAGAAFREHMYRIGAEPSRLTVQQATAVGVAHGWRGPPVGLLWHDAEHSAEAVARDLYAWKPLVAPGGAVVLHDAGNPEMGVEAGAAHVLDNHAWDWPARELIRWPRRPDRRGLLIVRRHA